MSQIVNGNIACKGILWDPHVLTTGTQIDNLAITSAVLHIDPTSPIDITGFDPNLALGSDEPYGSMLWIINVNGTNAGTLKHDSVATPSGHRVLTVSGADYTINAYSQAFLIFAKKTDGSRIGWWLFA